MNIEQLKAELEAKTKAVMEEVKLKVEVKALTTKLNLLDSPAYQESLVNQAYYTDKVEKLTSLIDQCKAVIESTPVQDTIKRQLKQWNGRPTFGLGSDMQLLHELCTGVLYSVTQHKVVMLGLTGININTVERMLDAMGQVAYFDKTNEVIVEAVPYNLPELLDTVKLLGVQLDVVIDTSKLTVPVFDKRFLKAELKAEGDFLSNSLLPQDTDFIMN